MVEGLCLHSAASSGNISALRKALQRLPIGEERQSVNAFNRFGMTALHGAVFHDQLDAAMLLIAHGADVGEQTRQENWTTCLHIAAPRGSAKLIKRLLQAGADPFLCNSEGMTPLKVAELTGNKHGASTLRQFMSRIQDSPPADVPHYDALGNGVEDFWWRVRRVRWVQVGGAGRIADGTDDGQDACSAYPVISDHYSDGGTAVANTAQRHTRPRLRRTLSEPLIRTTQS